MQPLPHPCFVPLLEATPAGHPGATSHLLGQHLPGDATLEDKQDAGESCPVVDAGPATFGLGRLFWQKRLDLFPQFITN